MPGRFSTSSTAAAAMGEQPLHAVEPPVLAKLALGGDEAVWREVMALHSNDALLPQSHLRASAARIGAAALAISALFAVLIVAVGAALRARKRAAAGGAAGGGKASAVPAVSALHTAYQITNLAVNLGLGVLGAYHFALAMPPLAEVGLAQRVEGWESVAVFAELQIGYQLWSIPTGLFLVGEHGAMLVHHACVMVVGSMSAFFTNGFRFYTPFFYGLIEISSVPLAVMNAFRASPAMARRHPAVHQGFRLVFSLLFLTVRIYMWVPQILDYLRVGAMLGLTCGTSLCRAGCALSWWAAVGLTCLQFIWGSKICKGLFRAFAAMSGRGREGGRGSKKVRAD